MHRKILLLPGITLNFLELKNNEIWRRNNIIQHFEMFLFLTLFDLY